MQRGAYPESLKALQEALLKDNFVAAFDPTDVKVGGQSRCFCYEPVVNIITFFVA